MLNILVFISTKANFVFSLDASSDRERGAITDRPRSRSRTAGVALSKMEYHARKCDGH